MNWRGGFLRLWIVGSVGWIVYVAFNAYSYYVEATATAARYNVESTSFTWVDLVMTALFAIIPCALALGAGVLIAWIIRGFAGDSRDQGGLRS